MRCSGSDLPERSAAAVAEPLAVSADEPLAVFAEPLGSVVTSPERPARVSAMAQGSAAIRAAGRAGAGAVRTKENLPIKLAMSISAAAPWAYVASLRVRKAPRDPLVAAIRIGTGPAGPTDTEL